MSAKPENAKMPESAGGFDESSNTGWVISYLDIITILLIFFVMLLSNSSFDAKQLMMDERAAVKNQDEPTEAEESGIVFPVKALNERLTALFEAEIMKGILELNEGQYETRLVLRGSAFFNLGEADLLPEGKLIVKRIVQALTRLENQDFKIDVEGHTDSAPIETLRFRNNWELSSVRAAGVVSYFLEEGTPGSKLKASGYADTFKLVEDRNEWGNFLPELQSINRRIVVRLYYD